MPISGASGGSLRITQERSQCSQRSRAPYLTETMTIAPAPPDLIYYDMFSTKTLGDPWTLDAFRKIFAVCAGHITEIFTYTCSTAVRSTMLAAGLYVAKGRATGAKNETTVGLSRLAAAGSHSHDKIM